MLGFSALGVAAIGAAAGIGVPTLSVTPVTLNGNVNIATLPITLSADTTVSATTIIEYSSNMGGLLVPPFLLGNQLPATIRFIPATLGLNTITFTNTGGANNPSPVTVNVSLTPAPPSIPPPTRILQGFIKTRAGVVRPNLTGLDYAYFDQTLPSALQYPLSQGSDMSTNAQGFFSLNVNSNLDIGDKGYFIVWEMVNGVPQQAFSGQVTLA